MDADARPAERHVFGVPRDAEGFGEAVHLEGAPHRALGMVGLVHRRVEDDEDRIALELADRAVVFQDGIGHAVEILVEEPRQIVRLERFRKRGEIGEVGEEKGHDSPLAFERHLARVADQALHHLGRDVAREGAGDELALLARLVPGKRFHDPMRRRERERRRDQTDHHALVAEEGAAADPVGDEKEPARAEAEGHRAAERGKGRADQRAAEHEHEALPLADARRPPSLDELRQRVRLNDDAGKDALVALVHGRERRAVPVGQGDVRADEHDLVLEPFGRQRRDQFGRIFAERRHVGRRATMPGDVGKLRRSLHADERGERAREAREIGAVGLGVAGIDPAHGVELVGRERREAALARRHEPVEEFLLLVVDETGIVSVAHHQRHLDALQRRVERRVLGRFGRLVEQDVEPDGARSPRRECRQKVAQELPVDRRAIGELPQRVLGDRHDDDVGALRLGRGERRDLPIAKEAVGIGEEGDVMDRERRGDGGGARNGQRHERLCEPRRSYLALRRGNCLCSHFT